MYGRLSIIAALSLIAALPAHAQLCAGTASYTTGRMQVGGQFVSNDDYSSYGVGLSIGKPRGLYYGAQIGNNSAAPLLAIADDAGLLHMDLARLARLRCVLVDGADLGDRVRT